MRPRHTGLNLQTAQFAPVTGGLRPLDKGCMVTSNTIPSAHHIAAISGRQQLRVEASTVTQQAAAVSSLR